MGKKTAGKKPQGGKTSVAERQLLPMEVNHLRTCMRNNARLQSLGLTALSTLFVNKVVISPEKRKPEHTRDESEAEYHPNKEDTSEGDSSDDSLVDEREVLQDIKSTQSPSSKLKGTNKKRSAAMAPDGIKPQPTKWDFAEIPASTRVTRSNKRPLLDADASSQSEGVSNPKLQTPISIQKPTVSVPEAEETVPNFDNHTHGAEDGDRAHSDHDYWLANGSDLIAHHDNQMDFEAGGSAEPHQQTQAEPNIDTEGMDTILWGNKGKGGQYWKRPGKDESTSGGKLPLIIPEGRLRPEAPVLAAKFATECNVTVRGHVPVFKHWKDYKDPEGNVREGLFQDFVGKVSNKFEMDLKDVPVRKACTQMLKGAIRQQRYRLKQKYFDPFPLNLVMKTSPVRSMTDDQWNELVESWKDPKKMEISEINKNNRAQVKFHQTTGSRSYPMHVDNLGDKYKEKEPTALDLFKECHYSSKKKGYTDAVQAAINEMESKASQPTKDGQQSNSPTKVVAEVLTKHTKKPTFLKHVGIQHVHERSSHSDREAELAARNRGNAELRALVETLTNKLKESEEARTKQEEENRKKQAEMNAKLDFLLSQVPSRSTEE